MTQSSHENLANRSRLAIISNSLPPYRVHLNRRIAREIPELELATLCTHEPTDGRWAPADSRGLGLVLFGGKQPSSQSNPLKSFLPDWRKGGRIAAWLASHAVRSVVISGYNDMAYIRVIRWCRKHRVPIFLAGDSNISDDNARGIKRFLKNVLVGWAVRSCAGVMPFGRRGSEYFLRYGADPKRIYLFPLEPDYANIENISSDTVSAVRDRYNLAADRRRIIFSGRLAVEKSVDTLIDAFTAIAAERPDWDLLIIGGGPLQAELEQRVPQNLRSRVQWTGKIADQETVSALYNACDVLVLPSRSEPWALVINEAAAAGLAIVSTTRAGATEELVRDGVNGRLFEPGDVPALVNCLLDVTQPDRTNAMKAESKEILRHWRNVGDPIKGLRNALASVGILPSKP